MSGFIKTEHSLALGLQSDPGPIPLILGIVGHRDPRPEAVPSISKRFESLLKSIIEICPNTPICMLNGLATGMDSIAAEVFIKTARLDRENDSRLPDPIIDRLCAVLPKPVYEYSADFKSAESRSELQALLQRCASVISPENTSELRSDTKRVGSEAECYARQGELIAKYSYVLVAFYNGVDTGLLGGTSQTLAIHRGDIHPLFHSTEEILKSREQGAAIIIHTPRLSSEGQAKHAELSDRTTTLPEPLCITCKYLDSINETVRSPSFKATRYNDIEGSFTKLWSHADRDAGVHKRRYERTAVQLVGVGFVLVACAELAGQISALGWGLVFVAFALFPKIQKRLQKPFLANRCLAESLTIQYIWSTLGIETEVADLLLSQGQEDLDRIRVILRSVAFQLREERHNQSLRPEGALNKAQIWLQGQIDFLGRRIKLYKRLVRRWRRIGYTMAAAALATASLQLLPVQIDWLSSVVPVLLAGFASSFAYQELMGYEETCERYTISLSQFKRASEALHHLEGARSYFYEEIEDPYYRHKLVLKAIGKEKIDELNEWMSNQLEKTYQPG